MLSITTDDENVAVKWKCEQWVVSIVLAAVLFCASAGASDIYFNYIVETDRTVYRVGDEVHWRISAGIEGDTRGIGGFDLDLYESMNEELNAPVFDYVISFEDMQFHPTYLPISYLTTGQGLLDFNFKNGFNADRATGGAGLVSGIGVSQFEQVLDQTGGTVCEGFYTVTRPGLHYLTPVHNSGYVWLDGQDEAEEISAWSRTGSSIYVIPDDEISIADINQDNIVNFKDFNSLANYWLASDCSDENYWCDGADINQDSFVDFLDLASLSDDWLWEVDLPFE